MSDDAFDEDVSGPCAEGRGVTINDFVAYLPTHVYIFTPCREIWMGASLNARLPHVPVLTKSGRPKRDANGKPVTILPTTWLDRNRAVVQMTWCPGYPMLIQDRLVVAGGWIERPEVTTFNHYRPPRIKPGKASEAGLWLEHLHKIYPDDADHSIKWLAHRVQRPGDKINHALVWGGAQGIGKDTLLEPIKHAVGPWNFQDIIPSQLLGRFNSFAKAVVLRINEAHDQGDAERINRFNLYERIKLYSANPPDVLRIDEKHLREYYVFNVLGLLITTNHKTDGIYLPADDRRPMSRGRTSSRKTSPRSTGTSFGAGTMPVGSGTLPPTSPSSTSPASTPRHPRRRRRRSGRLSAPTRRPKMPSWPMLSTRSAGPKRSLQSC
jgi:hypothetical protein